MSFTTNTNSILNQANPENFASMSRMDRLVAACEYMRNSVPTPGDQAPPIEENPPPVGVKALAAILVAMNGGGFVDDAEYEKLIQEERKKIADEERVLAARWFTLFRVEERGDVTPAILINPPEQGVGAMAALLAASEPYDPYSIWTQFTDEQLEEGAQYFYADLSNVGTFDKTASLDQIANSMLDKRFLTRTELILAMKCNYIGKHRNWAISVNFTYGPLMRTFRRRCGIKEYPCVCSHIEPNYFYN